MTSIPYLFLTFLRIGATSWGGFMALISLIQKKVVEKDRRLEADVIVEGISLASVLPGPMAVNVVALVGYRLAGWAGALVSVLAVLLPSFLLMLILSHLYFQYGDVLAMTHFFTGILPAVAAVIVSVAWNMGQKSIQDKVQVVTALAAAVITFFTKSYFTTLAVLTVTGLFGYFYYGVKKDSGSAVLAAEPGIKTRSFLPGRTEILVTVAGILIIIAFAMFQSPLWDLHKAIAFKFAGMSASQFGGGYVIIPSMQKVVVDSMHWVDNQEFVDAVAMGQITPGPIFVSATFIGYKLAGFWGALNATIAIFFPSAILSVLAARFFGQINKSPTVIAIFKALRPAIIGMIFAAAFTILKTSGFTAFPLVVFSAALLVMLRFKVDPVYVIPVAGVLGLAFSGV